MHRLLERERLETYAEALVTGTTAVLSEPLETTAYPAHPNLIVVVAQRGGSRTNGGHTN
jgi:hypothetical protein